MGRHILRGLALAVTTTVMLGMALVVSVETARAVTTNIPAGQQLIVEGETSASQATSRLLATVSVTTTIAGEIRGLRGSLPIEYTRTGTTALPDRLYHQASVRCIGVSAPAGVSHQRNLLLNDSTILAPRALVTFGAAGTYTCELRYELITSYVYNDSTDDVTTLSGGYLMATDPEPVWSEQCYWPTPVTQQPAQCDVSGVAEVASTKVLLGQTAQRRTPVRVTIPPDTEFIIYADATLTTCGGSGGNEGLCGTDEASYVPSSVSGQIRIFPQGSGDSYCMPTVVGSDGSAQQDIAVKTHHTVLYNAGRWRTSADPACTTDYVLTNTVTVTAGSPVIMHRNGSLLSIFN